MSRILKIVLPVLIVGVGVGAAVLFTSMQPQVSRQKPQARAVQVDVIPARKGKATVHVQAMGTVVPAREVVLKSEVGGRVVDVADGFTPGGRVEKGRTMLRIDPRDYRIAVDKAKGALTKAEADLKLEQGQQDVAKEDLAMLRKEAELPVTGTDLALRRPQLDKAKAEVKSAQADLEQAELNVERTRVTAPFNALITKRNVNLGSQVTAQEDLATLVATNTYWVQASVPVDSLQFLPLDAEKGCPVRIVSQAGAGEWSGRTLRLTGQVDETTRMAALIIEVPDPLGMRTQHPRLMLGDFVRVVIEGRQIANVFPVPRRAVHNGDRVWVVVDGRLDIRSVQEVWKDEERVYVSKGLSEGEHIVVSELPSPVQGMQVQVTGRSSQP